MTDYRSETRNDRELMMTATNGNGSFAGKVAFVTGAGSGMGRTTALAFAREGGASCWPTYSTRATRRRPA